MAKYKIVWASSTVYTCSNCGVWLIRYPDFLGEPFDKGSECEKCGCTSYKFREGRPFGRKSKELVIYQDYWNENEDSILDFIENLEIKHTIKTIPPLK